MGSFTLWPACLSCSLGRPELEWKRCCVLFSDWIKSRTRLWAVAGVWIARCRHNGSQIECRTGGRAGGRLASQKCVYTLVIWRQLTGINNLTSIVEHGEVVGAVGAAELLCASGQHVQFRTRTVFPSSCIQVGKPLFPSQPADPNRCFNRSSQNLSFAYWLRFEESVVFLRCNSTAVVCTVCG